MPSARVFRVIAPLLFLLAAAPLHAQQTGALSGKVMASDGSLLPGVTVEATSPVLPTPRVTVTGHGRRVPACRLCLPGRTR